jgi:hypothetical protein
MHKITSEELSKFELELNQFKFRGIPVGSLIGSHLNIDFLYGRFNPKDHLKEMAMFFYLNYFPGKQIKGFDFKKHEKNKGLPMLTFISERRHLFNMSYPVFEELGSDNVFCLIKNEQVLKLFKTEPKHYAFFQEIPTYPYRFWRDEFKTLWYQIGNTVEKFLERNEISLNYKLRLKNNILGETRYIFSFEQMIDFLKPHYILTHYDRYSFTAPLLSVAKKKGIPTFTMMHGVVSNSIGYSPLIADKVFVWGERQKAALMSFGIENYQIEITGATQLSNSGTGDKKQLKHELGISPDIKVILLATNPIQKKLRIKLFHIFCRAIDNLPRNEYMGFLKIHPSEDITFYESLEEGSSNIIFDKDEKISFDESFTLADLVCNYNSAYAIDAILHGLPLITINVDDSSLGQAKDYIENGYLPYCNNSDELATIIMTYFTYENYLVNINEKVNSYTKSYCHSFGIDAAKNILNILNSLK